MLFCRLAEDDYHCLSSGIVIVKHVSNVGPMFFPINTANLLETTIRRENDQNGKNVWFVKSILAYFSCQDIYASVSKTNEDEAGMHRQIPNNYDTWLTDVIRHLQVN